MPREQYQRRLADLRTEVREMADLVLDRFDLALRAYETGDEALAERVIEGDHEVNERYLDLEGECVDLLALQQPVAGDLRFVASSFKIVTDLERIGDLATNLAGYATEEPEPMLLPGEVRQIGDRAGALVEDAVAAYEDGDGEATWRIAARDDDLDEACRDASERVVRTLIEADIDDRSEADAAALLSAASRALLTIRDLERVGDHAVNVCARTLYMTDNDEGLIY